MNRKDVESLIAFALHLRGRLNGTDQQANVARDALELSRLAKRLHYLDELYANRGGYPVPSYDHKVHVALARAHGILKPYGYKAHHQENPQGASLYAAPLDAQEHDWEHDQEVPY